MATSGRLARSSEKATSRRRSPAFLHHLALLAPAIAPSPARFAMAMLPRSAARPALSAGFACNFARVSALPLSAQAGFHSSAAQQSTLRELEHRIKSVKNIEKITKVSSTGGRLHWERRVD